MKHAGCRKKDDGFAPLRKGLLEFAVLSVISSHEVYAADILDKLDVTPFATSEGTLYPLLSLLKRQAYLAYEWAESEAGPPRKYYSLTAAGQKRLSELHTYWNDLYKSLEMLGGKR
ncbi:PadR family transcriptional regulator [Candidatus Saccharibacteria bacterium]|nr:MAG: PadR family transcriptional regulator [Candidatus Saccharibacteria bacterium]